MLIEIGGALIVCSLLLFFYVLIKLMPPITRPRLSGSPAYRVTTHPVSPTQCVCGHERIFHDKMDSSGRCRYVVRAIKGNSRDTPAGVTSTECPCRQYAGTDLGL